MTEHCRWCPFTACPGCPYQGGTKPPTSVHYSRERERMDPVAKTPAPASTGPGRGRTRSATDQEVRHQ